jgi:hypothetical protein
VGDAGGGGWGGDGDPAAAAVVLLERRPQVAEMADRAHAVDPAVIDHRDPRRVIAAVLELLESGDQEVAAGASAHISDYSAHEGD